MALMKRPNVMTGQEFLSNMTGMFCYGWFRGGKYLYVGATRHGWGRILKQHHVFKDFSELQATDEIHVWPVESEALLFELEKCLIVELKPERNEKRPKSELRELGYVLCTVCNASFLQKRAWQNFCSKECRDRYWTDERLGKRQVRKCGAPSCGKEFEVERQGSRPPGILAQLCPDCRLRAA
jgi:hypothetical protein